MIENGPDIKDISKIVKGFTRPLPEMLSCRELVYHFVLGRQGLAVFDGGTMASKNP